MLDKILDKLDKRLEATKKSDCTITLHSKSVNDYKILRKIFAIKKITIYGNDVGSKKCFESADGKFHGIDISIYSPHYRNQNYRPSPPKPEEKRYDLEQELRDVFVMNAFFHMITNKEIATIDFDRAKALFKSLDLDFEKWFGKALEYTNSKGF